MPAEVVFYVLSSHSQQQQQDFVCKLIEKIYRSEQFCYVLVDSDQQAEQLDKLLWTFRAGSFIPHQIYQDSLPKLERTILIGKNVIPEHWQAVIVNLSTAYPPLKTEGQRILEILDSSEESRQAGRERYRHYQNCGVTITTHKL